MSADQLSGYVEVWWRAVDDLTTLLEDVAGEDWARPTDLPGWDVHAVAAHTAHLESLLAGAEHEQVEIGEPAHVRGALGQFTEQGVVARRGRTPDELINEIRSSATIRHTALLSEPPTDPTAPAPSVFGLIGWDTHRLLRNRPLDVWMHEQDVRRAFDRPGNLESPAAVHTADYLAESLGFVVGKRVGAPTGTTVRLEVAEHAPQAVTVGDDGRARPADPAAVPDACLAMDRESFIVLAGGRRQPPAGAVVLTGDEELGHRVLAGLAVTP